MRRTLLSIASVISLLLCLATVGFWVRSYTFADEFDDCRYFVEDRPAPTDDVTTQLVERFTVCRVLRGRLLLLYCRFAPLAADGESHWRHLSFDLRTENLLESDGFGVLGYIFEHSVRPGDRTYKVEIPLWAVSAVAAFSPICWSILWWRRRSRA